MNLLMIDINWNTLFELKIILLSVEEFFFVLTQFFFSIFLCLFSEILEPLLLIGLQNTRPETEWNLLDNWEWIFFEVLGKIFELLGEKRRIVYSSSESFVSILAGK